MILKILLPVSMLLAGVVLPLRAEDNNVAIIIKDHQFQPKEITIPANTKVKLHVQNLDASPEEFESHELKREKVIPGGSSAIISIGPLTPGSYKFFGEFHEQTAQGQILVK
jgi:plastocyanin